MALYAQFDVAMPRDRRMIKLGLLGRGLYVEVVFYCRENLTDGRIDPLELAYVAPDVSIATKKRLLNRMVELGSMEHDGDGWRIPFDVWCRWNPTKQQVEDKRAAEAQRKANFRKSVRGPSEDVPTGQTRTGADRASPVPDLSHRARNTPEPEPEPEPSSVVSADMSKSEATPGPDDDMGGIIDQIITRCAHRRTEQHRPDNPAAYKTSIEADMNRTERDAIATMLRERPFLRTQPEKAATRYELGRRDAARAGA